MLDKNTFFSLLFLFTLFPVLILSCELLKFTDELICLILLVYVGLDCLVNGRVAFRRYLPLWILTGVMGCYVLYSILFVHFNTPRYIVADMIGQMKPFVPFFVVGGSGMKLLPRYRDLAKVLCLVNVALMIVFYVAGHGELHLAFGHIAYLGGICMLSSLVFLLCSVDGEGKVSLTDFAITILILLVGLICGRSKYFGECVIVITLLFFYRPRLFAHFTIWHLLAGLAVLGLVVLVAWQKIEYYFVQSAMDMVNEGSEEAFNEGVARPVLYLTGGQILLDYFPFGSGLASFASYPSADHYSLLYYDYGLDKVWGLSPTMTDFICDAYYPTLCQLGIVGIIGFFAFWCWILKQLNGQDCRFQELFRFRYVVGLSLIAFILIESIGSTFFIQSSGMFAMMLLALIVNYRPDK